MASLQRNFILVLLIGLGVVPSLAQSPPGTKLWELGALGNPYGASPVVGPDGTIYVVGWSAFVNTLWSVRTNGTVHWAVPTDSPWSFQPVVGRDGTIYIGGIGKMNAYSPSGLLRWSASIGASEDAGSDFHVYLKNGPALGPDGSLYIGSAGPDNALYAFGPEGALKWRFQSSANDYYGVSTPVVGGDGTIYVQGDNYYALTP